MKYIFIIFLLFTLMSCFFTDQGTIYCIEVWDSISGGTIYEKILEPAHNESYTDTESYYDMWEDEWRERSVTKTRRIPDKWFIFVHYHNQLIDKTYISKIQVDDKKYISLKVDDYYNPTFEPQYYIFYIEDYKDDNKLTGKKVFKKHMAEILKVGDYIFFDEYKAWEK